MDGVKATDLSCSRNAAAAEIRRLDALNETRAKESRAAAVTIDHLSYIDYKQEMNPDYCAEGQLLGGVQCHTCEKEFVSKSNIAGFFPKANKPIWHCKNIASFKRALCNECYNVQLEKGGGHCKHRRQSTRLDDDYVLS